MAIEDYIPNVFSAPPGYEGLLGAEQSKKLEGRANLQGLLGAAGALAQGLGSQGPRRSALQNILGAISGGMQSSQGAYQQGLQNYSQQQQMQQANLLRGDIAKVMQMPEVANNPALIASLRSDPAGTLKWINENMRSKQALGAAYAPDETKEPQMQVIDGKNVLMPVPVDAKKNPLEKERERLELANRRLEGDSSPAIAKEREINLNRIKDLTSRIDKDYELQQKQTDYTNEARRVAAGLFPGIALEDLNQQQAIKLQTKLDQLEIAKRKAGATTINMPSESERTAGFLTNRVQNSLAQLQAATGKTPSAASPNFSAEVIRSVTGSDYLKNLANPEARQQVEAAQLEILDAALTLGTGAAYTREQLDNYRKSYFPQLNDKPATIADKAVRLKNMLDSAMIKAGRAAPNAIPQIDINAAIQQELDRRKGK